ncbi:unnamed protein product [Bemisia tabaci]|uniref:Uncharacterized protein n=1 Tax=Bemisia tabaci TaxID=7038 RepID=A0A9P0AIW9_BEMTA|nr:unnamed protein product [Bemisia tabaci]
MPSCACLYLVSLSGAKQVVLKDVKMELAGKYRCEVSADAPSFHTVMVSAHMHVVGEFSVPPGFPIPTFFTFLRSIPIRAPFYVKRFGAPTIPKVVALYSNDFHNASFSSRKNVTTFQCCQISFRKLHFNQKSIGHF